jgi:hypothetical protein
MIRPCRVFIYISITSSVTAITNSTPSVVWHKGAAGSAMEPLTTLRVDWGAPASFVTAARIILAPAAADDSIGTGHSGEASLALAVGLASVGLAGEARALGAGGAVDLIGFPIVCHMVFYSSNRRADCHSLFIWNQGGKWNVIRIWQLLLAWFLLGTIVFHFGHPRSQNYEIVIDH